jgi:Ca2+-transporting ATPase
VGANRLPEPAAPHPLLVFLRQFHQSLVYILIICAVISAFFQDWLEAGVIMVLVVINAVIGYIQETNATQALKSLIKRVKTRATVLREGRTLEIDSEGLVPGDVVLLEAGGKVPADLRLFYVRDLQIDESALTGESVPVSKQTEPLPEETPLGDRANMAFCSTLVTYGQGRGIVVATGGQTQIGRISTLIQTTEGVSTPLTRNIEKFTRFLFFLIMFLAMVTFAVGTIQGQGFLEMLQAAVALAVGAVPEALPAALTATLAIGVVRMARRRAIVRKLPAVETLGSTTVICSDKTGTLTANQLTVQKIWAGGAVYEVAGVGFEPKGEVRPANPEDPSPVDNIALQECLRAGMLCSDAGVAQTAGRWEIHGDPTEAALLVAAMKFGLVLSQEQARWPRLDTIPFDSARRYSATLHRGKNGSPNVAYVKGAAETILARCRSWMDVSGREVPLDPQSLEQTVEDLAAQGLRVLALARQFVPAGQTAFPHLEIQGELTLLGLQAMMDPPREEAVRAVRTCHQAGIRVKMITGDHARTAQVIAALVGIGQFPSVSAGEVDGSASGAPVPEGLFFQGPSPSPPGNASTAALSVVDRTPQLPKVLTGQELEKLSDEELVAVCEEVDVFARVTAEQKLRLVRALQARGHVVAMTGDGVNDAPALKQADIGVAMGLSGTEVAKEAADIVLTDDNFATIEAAVEEGRGVFDALTKFIVWTLPTNLGDGLVIMAAVLAGVALPILPLQVLWINTATVALIGMVLAFEPKERDIMLRKPRNPRQPILTRALVERIFLVGTVLLLGAFSLFAYFAHKGQADGLPQEQALAVARTVAVNYFVLVQLFYVFNCRSLYHSVLYVGFFSNPWVWVGTTAMILAQLLYTYAPFMNIAFESAPLTLEHWLWILGTSIWILPIVGLEKWLRQHLPRWVARRRRGAVQPAVTTG